MLRCTWQARVWPGDPTDVVRLQGSSVSSARNAHDMLRNVRVMTCMILKREEVNTHVANGNCAYSPSALQIYAQERRCLVETEPLVVDFRHRAYLHCSTRTDIKCLQGKRIRLWVSLGIRRVPV